MLLVNDPQDAPAGPKVVALGSFDGLHRGHQHLIAQAAQEARQQHLPLLVYTFDPPSKVLMRGEGVLSDLSEKVRLLRRCGVDIALIVPFTTAFSQRSKADFVEDVRQLEAKAIYVGEDFRFGQGRAGGVSDLQALAPTHSLPLVELEGGPVKSSRIRTLLREGQLEEVQALLGRLYCAQGIVQTGDQLGRTLGFPTANLQTSPLKILPMGVFAVWVHTAHGRYGGVANVGYRPTVAGQTLRFEVHLFGFEGDLYGQELRVEFVRKLRSEMKFEGLEALKTQIAADAQAAKAALGLK